MARAACRTGITHLCDARRGQGHRLAAEPGRLGRHLATAGTPGGLAECADALLSLLSADHQ
jgi:hypothetical protein